MLKIQLALFGLIIATLALGTAASRESSVPAQQLKLIAQHDTLPDSPRFHKLVGDFDHDGRMDHIRDLHPRGLTIQFADGETFVFEHSNPRISITTVEPILLGPEKSTSFAVSMVENHTATGGFFERTPQVLLFNDGAGNFRAIYLDKINILGRGVTCTNLPFNPDKATCMFASYGRKSITYSALVEIDASGSVVDVTRAKGLPFYGAEGTAIGKGHQNGKYMMGFAFVDLDSDGLPDLVGGGQHSQLMFALMKRSGDSYVFSPTQWFDQKDEYLGISSLYKPGLKFPCVYAHIESTPTDGSTLRTSDYIKCFDSKKGAWSDETLPATLTSGEKIVSFDANQIERSSIVERGDQIYFTSWGELENGSLAPVLLSTPKPK